MEGEAREQTKTADGSHPVLWAFDNGIDNGQGWYLQGFIEAADGSLRPQTFAETAYCAGCHGGVGRTTDSIFSFSRKLPAEAPDHGWFHFARRGLTGVAEPRSRTRVYEYARYLREAGAATTTPRTMRCAGASSTPREPCARLPSRGFGRT